MSFTGIYVSRRKLKSAFFTQIDKLINRDAMEVLIKLFLIGLLRKEIATIWNAHSLRANDKFVIFRISLHQLILEEAIALLKYQNIFQPLQTKL
jgi:hypothetical protein